MVDDKALLISGGTGSFDIAVLRRFLQTNVREVRVFSRDEKSRTISAACLAKEDSLLPRRRAR